MGFESLSENCQELRTLKIDSLINLRTLTSQDFRIDGFKKLTKLEIKYSNLKNYDMGSGGICDWFFGLFNDCNNLEELNLICLNYAKEEGGKLDGIAAIERKFKKLKKCFISLHL